MNSKLNLPVGVALFAALAVGLMFLLSGGLLQAQDNGPIMYAENDMGAVATFTGSDPEDRKVYWSLLPNSPDILDDDNVVVVAASVDAADVNHFMISSDGVLSFKFSPDYEMPRDAARTDDNTNTYKVVVVASDDAPGAGDMIEKGYKKVTVMVTDVDEPGMVTLSAQQPQVGVELTATLTDDDAATDADEAIAAQWKWEHSSTANGPWAPILTGTATAYTPLGVVDKYLRVTATYTDKHGSDKSVMAVSANMVRAEPQANNANPVFPDEDPDTNDTQVSRKVDENSPSGTNVGEPVVANDAPGDVLTYTLTGENADDGNYRIDQATGQITVGPRTMLDAEGGPDRDTNADGLQHRVTVTATDPTFVTSNGTDGIATQIVTITINDVNEAPMMSGGFTRNSHLEYDSGDTTGDEQARETRIATAKVVDIYMATDPEISAPGTCAMASCTWSVSGTDAGDFEISNNNEDGNTFGELTFKKAPNFEMPADSNGDNVYKVTVVVTDQDTKQKLSARRDVTITVTNVDENGTVTLSSDRPKVGIALTATLEDPDGVVADSVKWTWHDVDAATVTNAATVAAENAIAMATSATYTPEETGTLSVRASYTDGHGASKSVVKETANMVVENLANVAPKFPATETGMREVAENTPAEMDINDGDDDDDDADPVAATDDNELENASLTYTLSGTDAASFVIVRSSGQLQTKAELDYEVKNSYMVTVTATDSDGLSDSIDVTIKVTEVDEAPEIAGDDIAEDFRENGSNLVIERFRATDPEGRKVYWSLPAGSDVAVIAGMDADDAADIEDFMISSDGVLSFKFSPDYEMPLGGLANESNTYNVVVAASDNALGAETTDNPIMVAYKKVVVTVTNVEETETVTLSARQAQVGVALTATYNDLDNEMPDGTVVTWKWYLGTSEIPGADEDTYRPTDRGSLRAEASYTRTDGSAKTASKTVSVRVVPTAPNVDPNFGVGSGARSVDENSPPGTRVGKPVAAIDPGDVLTYTMTDDTNSFDIDQASGQITVGARTTLDTEATSSYTVTVNATDPAGATSDTPQTVTITINDVNEAPMMSVGFTRNSQPEYDSDDPANAGETGITEAKVVGTYMATDPEIGNGALCVMASCTWSVSGTDAEDFEISNEAGTFGALTFKEAPDFEMPADSNRDNVYMVTVVVTDNDTKQKLTAMRGVTITVTNVNEDGTVTLSSEQPKIGIELTATLMDPDGVVADSVKWTWHRVSATEVTQTTDANAIDMATSDTYTPMDAEPLSAKASYTDGHGAGKSEVGSEAPVVVNTANVAPKFAETETGMREVAEGTDAAMPVGEPVPATDANEPAEQPALTYTLSGTDAASFGIERDSGQLQTKAELDYETKKSYLVTVTATDSDSASASIDVTITVTDEDEAPVITLGGLTISGTSMAYYEENRMDAVETYMASGPMASRARWSLAGDDAGDFRISQDGVLTFRSSPDYENPTDMGPDNTYKVTVKANDGTYMDTQDVIVMVTDVEELGMLSGNSSPSYMENSEDVVATYTPSGPDIATWSLEGTDKGYFTITGGMLKFRNSPNYEMPRNRAMSGTNTNEYMVTVKAKAGGEMDEIMVTVTVANVEEIGTLSGSSSRSYMENSDDAVATYTADGSMADMATWSLSGTDRRDFTITGGTLNFRSAPDYEMPMGGSGNDSNTYMVTVKAEAGGEMDMVDVTITVTDENDPGTVSLSSMHPVVGVALTASLTDPDGSISGITWQWASSDTSGGTYININISGAMSASYTPVEADEGDYLRATASYTDGHGSGNTAFAKTAMTAAPVMLAISGPSDPSYTENGTDAIGPYTASGPGATSATWTLEGDDADDFVVEGSGASAMLKFSSPPDYENPTDMGTDNTYKVTVKANDGTYMDTHDVTVAVTNVEELGTLSGDSNPSYMENGDGAVGTYTASGPMSDVATWSLMGDDMDDLSISTGGELTFDATPDFEMPMDQDMDNTYKVTVMAKAGGEMKEIPVIVMVTNVDEMGTLVLSSTTPSVDDELTATLTDLDGMVSVETWMWYRSMDGNETVIADATSMSYTPVADDAGYYLKVTVTYTDGEGSGKMKEEMTAAAVTAGDPLLAAYDSNKDGWIQEGEVRVAVGDYFAPPKGDKLSLADTRKVVGLYFAYKNRQ